MSTDTQEVQEQRAAKLAAGDAEFAAARPDQAVSDAIEAAGPHLAAVVDAVLQGYSDRPALAQRMSS
jgi:fatty acid CoA ligase FadD9